MKANLRIDIAQIGRRTVQVSFLLLFLFPLGVVIYKKASFNPGPSFPSWLLPWDPALLLSQVLLREFTVMVIGAPLLLLAFSFVFGRFFCGWVCPVGTLLDLVRPLAFWQKRRQIRPEPSGIFPAGRNRRIGFYLLAAILGASVISLKLLGLLDPLVIFQRGSTALASNYFSAQQPGLRAAIALVSLVFLGILLLEFWQPRFWCRNLCPQGALLSLVSRFSLFRRQVSAECTHCAQCQRACPMNAISALGAETDYADCTFCLECTQACPKAGIDFGFPAYPGLRPVSAMTAEGNRHKGLLSRRGFLRLSASLAGGAAIVPLSELAPRKAVLRPPGALPEREFVRTCIICQECVRICPTGALRPVLLESGLAGIGTPVLVPRQGGCALNPSCPDLCAAACPVGAIRPVTKEEIKIGIAVVHREACLAWDQGAKCLVCVEACLYNAAIPYNGRVTVDASRCTGCGRCESGCPIPGSAIRVEPLESGSTG